MVATNEQELAELFEEAIVGITPRLQHQGSKDWKFYKKEVGNPSRTRRFKLLLRNPRLRPGGAVAGNIMEHQCELRVRTDYAGDPSETQHMVSDDFLQLRDVLSTLKASDNGLILVEADRSTRDSFDDTSAVMVVDHIYSVRYMRTTAL